MGTSKKNKVNFIVTIDKKKIANIHKIASSFKQHGIHVEQVLSFSGIITGSASNLDQLKEFQSIGVKSIELDKGKRAL